MSSSWHSRLTETQFRGAVIAINALLVLLIVRMRFCYEPEVPPGPPKPKISLAEAKATSQRVARKVEVYAEYLARDARAFGAPATTVEMMRKAIPYRQSRMRHLLLPGGDKSTLTFAGLELTVRVGRVQGSTRPQMLLDVANTTDTPLAYRISTRPSKGTAPCSRKANLDHNAIAVAPGATETRTECIYRRSWGLEIARIEVMRLPPLSYYYVSQVPPETLGVDGRVAAGHVVPGHGKPCRTVLGARTRRALESGAIEWRDMVDFYARHSCDTYDFPDGYVAWTEDDQGPLPAAHGR